MKNVKLSVVTFNDNDVIATSGAVITASWTGLFDGTPYNAKLNFNKTNYTLGNTDTLETALKAAGATIGGGGIKFYTDGAISAISIGDLFDSLEEGPDSDYADPTADAMWNGTYKWDTKSSMFVKSSN